MRKLKSFLGGVVQGLLKSAPVVGNVVTEVKASIQKDSPHSPKGRIDWGVLFGYSIMAIIVLAVIFGKLDLETAEKLIKKLNLFSFFS